MKGLKLVLIVIISAVFLSGCASDRGNENNREKNVLTTINIPHVNEYSFLYVQGAKGNASFSESTSTTINDNKKIKEFINKIDGMKVTKPSDKELAEQIKALNRQDRYTFILSNSETMDDMVYPISIYKDGIVQFQDPEIEQITLISKEKYPELFGEIKDILEITF
ncbi:hypothetical protein [Bacillus massiliigorillae]|uniref:hypothetical protein n=1 Tax=Bacillus massiliigorillae TaxID=1243664 RepID=UPI00039B7534|nr:hypothetical protein [Bacillus massiliigorillae]